MFEKFDERGAAPARKVTLRGKVLNVDDPSPVAIARALRKNKRSSRRNEPPWRQRLRAVDIEVRDAPAEQAGSVIRGYAALYDVPATIGGLYIEKIAPGAFTKTIQDGDVLALIAHDWGRVLGRQSAGTLRLKDTPIGLSFELDADLSTPSGQEALGNVRRKDVRGCSFGFFVLRDDWDDAGEFPVRTLLEISLREISILANPAYETTSAWVSSRSSNANNEAAKHRIEAAQRRRGIIR